MVETFEPGMLVVVVTCTVRLCPVSDTQLFLRYGNGSHNTDRWAFKGERLLFLEVGAYSSAEDDKIYHVGYINRHTVLTPDGVMCYVYDQPSPYSLGAVSLAVERL
jgi:hypothetical protein